MLNKGGNALAATAKATTTADLKALELEGFEVRAGAFNGYPVPVWTPAESPVPPAKTFGCTLVFRGLAEDGTVTLLATAIMALPVLPGVIITDRGLVDGLSQQFIEQFEG